MPLFFFDVADGLVPLDDEGVEIPSIRGAKSEAVRLLGEMMRDNPDKFLSDDEMQVTVKDADHLTLFRVNVHVMDAPSLMSTRPLPPVLRAPLAKAKPD